MDMLVKHYKNMYKCNFCNKQFKGNKGNKNKFCSVTCRDKGRVGKYGMKRENNPQWKGGKNCIDCGRDIKRHATRCKACRDMFFRGERSSRWKGGVTNSDKIERHKFGIEIQKMVLARDNYTCQICGDTKEILHVDHVQKWSEYIELRFSMDNCRTVCRACHYQITFGKPMPKNSTWGTIFRKREAL